MLKGLISDFKLHKDDLMMPLLVVSACWLMGFGLCCVIMFTIDDPGSWVTFGTFMAFFFLIMFAVMFFAKFHQEFMLALSMGRTRTEFLLSYALRTLVWLIAGYGLLLVLYRVELALGAKLFAQWPLEVDPTFLMDWCFVLILIPGVVLLSMFMGVLYSRFGRKALTPFWLLWMVNVFVLPTLLPDEGETPSHLQRIALNIAQFIGTIPDALLIALGVVIAGGMLVATIMLGKKQMVR